MGKMVRSGAERGEREDGEKEMKHEAFRVGNRDETDRRIELYLVI
jgi:hypothetical protein